MATERDVETSLPPRPRLLSERIRALVARLEPDLPVYDLCCDHGLIGLLAWQEDPQRPVTFVDQSSAALEALQKELSKERYQKAPLTVEICEAESLGPLSSSSNIVIAGVGNATILRILHKLVPERAPPHRLVLCSQQEPTPLLRHGEERGWILLESHPVNERGRVRTILSFKN